MKKKTKQKSNKKKTYCTLSSALKHHTTIHSVKQLTLCNKLNPTRVSIGPYKWSIGGQTHYWRNSFSLHTSCCAAVHVGHVSFGLRRQLVMMNYFHWISSFRIVANGHRKENWTAEKRIFSNYRRNANTHQQHKTHKKTKDQQEVDGKWIKVQNNEILAKFQLKVKIQKIKILKHQRDKKIKTLKTKNANKWFDRNESKF